MAANYSQVVAEMSAAGLMLPGGGLTVGTGKTIRCRVSDGGAERRGWYRLSEIDIDGETYLVGAYGIWHGNDNGKTPVRPDRRVRISPEQRQAIASRIQADAAKAKAQRQAQAERASRAAAAAWRKYEPTGHSDYLARKGVGAHGVRFHPAGTIAVPMMDPRGKIWGLQIIRGRNRGERLEKQYWPRGMEKVGRYHLIGGTPRGLLLVAEGYATAATLHEATGLPVAVAFDANNLQPVAVALAKTYKSTRLMICADDDFATAGNPGVAAAAAAALAVDGTWLAPVFSADEQVQLRADVGWIWDDGAPEAKARVGACLSRSSTGKLTDFNDLAAAEGQATVRAQVESHLAGIGWSVPQEPARVSRITGGGDAPMAPRLSVEDAAARYWGTYGLGGKVLFDERERRLIHRDDVINLLPRHGWESLKEHPDWRVARDSEIGFDPGEEDPRIKCNLFGGWPTEPRQGRCEQLLALLEYLCDAEDVGPALYDWVLNWLAYPLQHRGAKMQTAVVVHGPQGTGKSLFFESYAKIFGDYARVLGQEALEDKFNADWAEKKLFILADAYSGRSLPPIP